MSEWLFDIIYPINRWMHLVCTTLILGGTLFFELVLPASIEDLKREQQLYVFARARWVFRWVVWVGVLGLVLSGSLSLYQQWEAYRTPNVLVWRWAVGHVALGLVTMTIALLLTIGNRPPENPVFWMRLNVVILIVVIFLASATRHFQLDLRDRRGPVAPPGEVPMIRDATADEEGIEEPATQTTTRPSTRPAGAASGAGA